MRRNLLLLAFSGHGTGLKRDGRAAVVLSRHLRRQFRQIARFFASDKDLRRVVRSGERDVTGRVAPVPGVKQVDVVEGHHNLEAYLDAYIEAANIRDAGNAPLFRSAAGRSGALTEKPMNRVDAWRMIERRAGDLKMRVRVGCLRFGRRGSRPILKLVARSKTRKPWLRMEARPRPNSAIARARSRSMRWSGLRFR